MSGNDERRIVVEEEVEEVDYIERRRNEVYARIERDREYAKFVEFMDRRFNQQRR